MNDGVASSLRTMFKPVFKLHVTIDSNDNEAITEIICVHVP